MLISASMRFPPNTSSMAPGPDKACKPALSYDFRVEGLGPGLSDSVDTANPA